MRKAILLGSTAMMVHAKPDENGSEEREPINVKPIKAGYKQATGKSLAIKDSILVQLLERHPEFFDDMDDDQQIKFLAGLEEQVKDIAVTDPAIGELVAKIDDAAEAEIMADIDATIKAGNTSMSMLRTLRRIYTKDEILGMAVPGLDKADMSDKDNRKPDIVTTKLKNGDEVTTVWTDTFCSTWEPVKKWETDIDDAKKEKKSSGSVTRYKHLGKRELDNILRLATKKRNAFRSMFKRALKLEHQLSEIEAMPAVVLEFSKIPAKDTTSGFNLIPLKYGLGEKLKDTDCIKVTLAPSPFWMYPKDSASDGKPYSVTQINNMDVRAAIAAGGEMANLTDTIAKGADDDDDANTGDGTELDIDEAYVNVSRTVNWLKVSANLVKVRKILADPKHPDHADWLSLVGELATAILPTYRRNKAAYEKAAEIPVGTGEDAKSEAA